LARELLVRLGVVPEKEGEVVEPEPEPEDEDE